LSSPFSTSINNADPTGQSAVALDWNMTVNFDKRYGSQESDIRTIATIISQLQG